MHLGLPLDRTLDRTSRPCVSVIFLTARLGRSLGHASQSSSRPRFFVVLSTMHLGHILGHASLPRISAVIWATRLSCTLGCALGHASWVLGRISSSFQGHHVHQPCLPASSSLVGRFSLASHYFSILMELLPYNRTFPSLEPTTTNPSPCRSLISHRHNLLSSRPKKIEPDTSSCEPLLSLVLTSVMMECHPISTLPQLCVWEGQGECNLSAVGVNNIIFISPVISIAFFGVEFESIPDILFSYLTIVLLPHTHDAIVFTPSIPLLLTKKLWSKAPITKL